MSTTFNFPANPAIGDQFTMPNGIIAQWNGTEWVSVGDSTSTVTYPLPITLGGTGANAAGPARVNLGLNTATGEFIVQKDGTVTNPGIAFASEAGLGWYRPSAGNLSLAVRGKEMAAFIMSGNDANFALKKTASGTANQLLGYTGNSLRWSIVPGDGVAESGSNVGSDFVITRFSDTGAPLGAVLSFSRSAGNALFSGTVNAPTVSASLVSVGGNMQMNTASSNSYLWMLSGQQWYWVCAGATGDLTWQRPAGAGSLATVFAADGSFYAGGPRVFTGNGSSMGMIDNPAGSRILRFTQDGWRIEWPGTGDLIYGNPTINLFVFGGNGQGYQYSGSTTWQAVSDMRLKSNSAPLAYGLDEILQLEPITYDIYETKGAVGLSAQVVHKVMPKAGATVKNMDPESDLKEVLTYNADYVYFALINAIKTIDQRLKAIGA